MAHNQIIPQPRRFLPGLRECLPLRLAAWKPVEFNRSVCRVNNYTAQYTGLQGWLTPGTLSATAVRHRRTLVKTAWLSRGLKP
jgi:hypothetical protein